MTVFRKLLTNRNGGGGGEDEEGGWLEELGEEGRVSSRRDPAGAEDKGLVWIHTSSLGKLLELEDGRPAE